MINYRVSSAGTLLLTGCLMIAGWAYPLTPGEGKEPNAAEVLDELRDPAFDKYVDLRSLAAALETQDAVLLADVAIKLAEGERAVGRPPHKGLSANAALRLAMDLAAEKHDKKTLDRLAGPVKARGDARLSRDFALKRLLGSAPRKADPSAVIAADQTTPEAMTLYRNLLGEVQQAKLTSDRKALDQLEQSVGVLTELHEKQRAYLGQLIADSRSALPAKENREAAMLRKLAALSRKPPPAGSTTDRAKVQANLKKGWVGIAFAKDEYRTATQALDAVKKKPLTPPGNGQLVLAQLGVAVYQHFPPRATVGQAAYYSYQPFVRWKASR
jgi:hypothetical protein